MADLKNEFSWSTSRRRLYDRCLRAYWWRYYAHWYGWMRSAPEEARIAYRLGKQDSFATWGGTIVHDLIEAEVKQIRDTKRAVSYERMEKAARDRLRTGWVESRDGLWRRDPKRKLSLWEHYYGDPSDRSKERTDAIAEKVYTSMRGFVDGPFPDLLMRTDRSAFKNIEVLDSIKIDGHTIYVKPDLAFVHPDDGLLWLVDWKTGKPGAADDFQVATYALFAREKWGVEPGGSKGVLVYLAEGEQKEFELGPEALDRAEATIKESLAEMRGRLSDPENNAGDMDDFPMAEDRQVCTWCGFKQLCFGGAGVPGAALAGDSI